MSKRYTAIFRDDLFSRTGYEVKDMEACLEELNPDKGAFQVDVVDEQGQALFTLKFAKEDTDSTLHNIELMFEDDLEPAMKKELKDYMLRDTELSVAVVLNSALATKRLWN